MVRLWFQALSLLLLLTHTTALQAQLPRADRKQAKAYLSGPLYARIDLPCSSGAHPMGTYMIPLVEVSPDAVNTEGEASFTVGWMHGHGTYWGVGPNDTVQFDEMEIDGDTIEAEFEGIGKTEGNATVIKFVKIQSLDDFKKAVDRAFARGPLQDEHDDWSPEIKRAIAERQLMKGMTNARCSTSPAAPRTSARRRKKPRKWKSGLCATTRAFGSAVGSPAPPPLRALRRSSASSMAF
jgi:hypothetical protein